MEDLSSIVNELENIKISLQQTLDQVSSVLTDIRIRTEGLKVEFSDNFSDFSEKKEKFIAP